jgi:hypothetical protein
MMILGVFGAGTGFLLTRQERWSGNTKIWWHLDESL